MKTLSPTFFIGSIQIGTIQDASCVNLGNNFPTDFTSQKKQNQGFGSITGDHNDIHEILSRMSEKDSREIFMDRDSVEHTRWLQKIMDSMPEVDIDTES